METEEDVEEELSWANEKVEKNRFVYILRRLLFCPRWDFFFHGRNWASLLEKNQHTRFSLFLSLLINCRPEDAGVGEADPTDIPHFFSCFRH